MKKFFAVLAAIFLAVSASAQHRPLPGGAVSPTEHRSVMRLYVLDCGRIDFTDMRVFSDTGAHDGEQGVMPVSCFLIHHGKDWMLWDAGLGDEIARDRAGEVKAGLHFRVPVTLASQLRALGVAPDDIKYVGLSHLHADHSGNARLFPHATFLVSSAELAWAGQQPPPDGVLADRVAAVKAAKVQSTRGDLDVFGDKSVQIIRTPGHTPGHQSLMVTLQHSGTFILSGDVAHFQLNYEKSLVPVGNTSRAETLAAIDRVKGLAARFHAKVVIQHASNIFEQLPKAPAYLD